MICPQTLMNRLRRDETGAALVEFAILLPILLLLFAVIIEGGRLMWSYQTVVAGVRDAARYVARAAPQNICSDGGSLAGYADTVGDIVRESISGNALFPAGVTVLSVTPTLDCITGTYRISPVGVVEVSARLQITFPFASIFGFNGGTLGTVTTTVRDQNRVFGT
ncbi:TadE/TadG family type IV pilus assembly protein [Seohaeicola zhoushanensis]|uniref:TadE-like domain-containing protein n=1 Tax=Seohaeicola zhoushanensis TaxID=1569283 RepID=A0A8J3H007_9RHOB|nr:TadE/TadG family type IV pilus assembly protein [Seohaeicola zhoushanensis]GHF58962.1 hypothetical protein GCM10017056_33020 [Seohaeicola zhoushanensis]